ncbi:hypothetical protein J2X65_003548 [Ancylobacter sp. 3268]|uniref:hypothetical protein n=1 Tax=Ancylobacter sp. 3268 TaxID=2817752 RepID=UPI00286296EB|nr:hypothetical protein [Ancylobacter sp. 3268]MDR6954180.1 hypothetical protein [Ancylobacter sp. 3268]
MAKKERIVTSEHNEKTQQEIWEDQKFLDTFGEIKRLESDMASTKGDIGAALKRLKDMGWTKKDLEFAKTLEDKDVGQVVADFERKIRIAKLFGHRIGRQMSLLDEDPASQDERAYQAGFAAGRLRKQIANPYQPSTREFERWEDGIRDGNKLVNKELAGAMAEQPD